MLPPISAFKPKAVSRDHVVRRGGEARAVAAVEVQAGVRGVRVPLKGQLAVLTSNEPETC